MGADADVDVAAAFDFVGCVDGLVVEGVPGAGGIVTNGGLSGRSAGVTFATVHLQRYSLFPTAEHLQFRFPGTCANRCSQPTARHVMVLTASFN